MILVFLLGKAATTVFDLKVTGLPVDVEAAPMDSSGESTGEVDTLEGDDELLYDIYPLHDARPASLSNMTFHLSSLLESAQEVTIPPPKA